MVLSSHSRKRPPRRGTTAVEFAVVAPIFFLVVFAIVEFGRMMMVEEILVNAARLGARAAILPSETDSQVATVVSNYLAGVGISGYTTSLMPTLASGPASGTALTVTISVPWTSVSWFSYSTWLQGATLAGSAAMIKE